MLRRMSSKTVIIALFAVVLAGCNSEIYLRDGVTDGDTFYLADRALADADPVLQSWVSYSLAASACQLAIGGDNPARASSFDCEVAARRILVESWQEKKDRDGGASDAYLDELAEVGDAGYLGEYVARNLRRRDWQLPHDLRLREYDRWADATIPDHHVETRLIGSWNYARNVSGY